MSCSLILFNCNSYNIKITNILKAVHYVQGSRIDKLDLVITVVTFVQTTLVTMVILGEVSEYTSALGSYTSV